LKSGQQYVELQESDLGDVVLGDFDGSHPVLDLQTALVTMQDRSSRRSNFAEFFMFHSGIAWLFLGAAAFPSSQKNEGC
jgi:hypothetical protein